MPKDPSFKPLIITGGDGENSVRTQVQPTMGLEQKPCLACVSWRNDNRKLVQFLRSRKDIEVHEDGTFSSAVLKDFPDREGMRLDTKDFGWCEQLCMPTDMLASCEKWSPRNRAADFGKLSKL